MAIVWLQVRNGGLYPADEAGRDFLASIDSPEVKAEITAASLRSLPEHRLYFKVLSSVYEANDRYQELYDGPEHLRAHLLIKVGHCDSDTYEAESYEAALLQTDAIRKTFERTRRKGQYAVLKTVHQNGKFLSIFKTPRSVSITGKNSIGQRAFHLIVTQTFDIISRETTISVDDLKHTWDELRKQYGKRISA